MKIKEIKKESNSKGKCPLFEKSFTNSGNKGKCPFLQDPSDECYSANLTSLKIWAALHYCSEGFFEECEIYKYKKNNP